jgi:hypothetical protein
MYASMSPWLPEGFSFLSGLPEAARKRRLLMPIQVVADESVGAEPGTRSHFVMAGLIGHSEDWAEFSTEWDICLKSGPRRCRSSNPACTRLRLSGGRCRDCRWGFQPETPKGNGCGKQQYREA